MRKRVIYQMDGLYRDDFRITGYEFGEGENAVCIVGSSRGNEVQQIYCCAKLVKKFRQLETEGRIKEGHKILIIPSMNPYSMNIKKRFWPTDNTDINRMFPGYDLGETTQRIADGVFREISEYRYGIQFTSFYMPGDFVPHVRLMEEGYSKTELAEQFGLPYVVVRKVRPYDTATLNYNWQVFNTTAFSVYSGSTSLVDMNQANASVDAIIRFLIKRGVISEEAAVSDGVPTVHVGEGEMKKVQTQNAGLLHKMIKPGDRVNKGQVLGIIIDPYEAEVLEEILSPCDGVLFFSRTAEAIAQHELVFTVREE